MGRTSGTADELQRRRRQAVAQVNAGESQQDVAEMFGVSPSAVSQWMRIYRQRGDPGLAAKPMPGRPGKLSRRQERQVLGWFSRSATEFGFPNELWTAPRVAQIIRQRWKIQFHPRYLNAWLAQRRITPQKPRRQPRERNDEAIRHWVRYLWPRIKNERRSCARISS